MQIHLWVFPHSAFLHKVSALAHAVHAYLSMAAVLLEQHLQGAVLKLAQPCRAGIAGCCALPSDGLCTAQIVFAYASGPLAWSILAFRNSLVFHSLDKVGFGGSSPVYA